MLILNSERNAKSFISIFPTKRTSPRAGEMFALGAWATTVSKVTGHRITYMQGA